MPLELIASHTELSTKFFSLQTPRDIADMLEVEYAHLIYYLYKIPESERYESFTINKKSGGNRQISAPATPLKIIQKKLNYVLQRVYDVKAPAHAYVSGKSIVSNAKMHLRKRYVLNVDLKNFFPSITFRRVRGLFEAVPYKRNRSVATVLARICCNKNCLPQGAPSSPIVSNMICARMDSQLRRLAVKYRCVYTRYADDLTFSTSLREFPEALAKVEATKRGNELKIGPELKHIIDLNGFEINRDKIRLQTADRRQVVTGLTVNQFPNVSRRYLSQVRAMLHAWKTHGLDNAQNEFYSLYNKKSQSPHKTDVSFANVVQGKIEFLGMVRGKHDPTYLQFLSQLAALAPDMVKRSEKDIEDERKVRIKLKEVLTELFNGGELNVLCFELGIEIENIKGSNKSEKVIELIKYIERRDRMPELVKIVTKKRPGKL